MGWYYQLVLSPSNHVTISNVPVPALLHGMCANMFSDSRDGLTVSFKSLQDKHMVYLLHFGDGSVFFVGWRPLKQLQVKLINNNKLIP